MKKTISFILIAIFCITLFTSCDKAPKAEGNKTISGDAGGLTLPLDNNNTSLSFTGVSSVSDPGEKYVFKKLREITGIDLQISVFPAAVFMEKVSVLIATKNLPDIIGDGVGTITQINDLSSQGAFASVGDYLDEMPNFRRIFKDDPKYDWVFKSYAATDGKLYGLPHFDTSRDVNHGMLYRKDIFDKHNIPMWNSPEELYQALKKLKALYPDSSPFSASSADGIFAQLSTSWGVVSHQPYFDEEAREWHYSDTDEKTKDMLDYLRKLYDEELIDPEFLTMTLAAWTTKMTQPDKSFVTFAWIGRMDPFAEQTRESYPEYDLRYANPMGPKGTIITLPKVLPMFATVAANGNAALSMKLMDFLYSDKGAELMTLGTEGETYTIGDNGKAKYIEFLEGKKVEMSELEEKYGMFVQGTYKRMDKRSAYFNYSEREQEAQDKAIKEKRLEPEDPVLAFTKEETELIAQLQPALTTVAKETFVNYILNAGGDRVWQEWLNKAEGLGANRIIKVYNDAQKRFEGD